LALVNNIKMTLAGLVISQKSLVNFPEEIKNWLVVNY